MERTNFLQFSVKVSRQPQTNKIGLLSRNLLNQQWGRHISSFLGPGQYKKDLVEIIKKTTYFEIFMYKENGEDIKLKEKYSDKESDDSGSDDSDSDSGKVHWYWRMKQQKNIRDSLTVEKLGSFKNSKILPTLKGFCVLILFENLLIEFFVNKEIGKTINNLFPPIPNTTLYK
jgi:hypothetical protein